MADDDTLEVKDGRVVRNGSEAVAMVSDLALEETCPECDGSGTEAGGLRCYPCKGKGLVTTDFGDAVLALVQRHSGVIF